MTLEELEEEREELSEIIRWHQIALQENYKKRQQLKLIEDNSNCST